MSFTPSTLSTRAREIRATFRAIDLDVVAQHFEQDADEIDPDDGRVLIIDFPTPVHETTADIFKDEFLTVCGNRLQVNRGGSIMTVRRTGCPKKEVDATFGPLRSTPNRTAPPPPRTFADWATLAVEVGRARLGQVSKQLRSGGAVMLGFSTEGERSRYADELPLVRCQ
ncbi:unnamed protein product [Phytophthora lilii]|uniref:Unnamed protein product n=1 Tax=Phytophthora lilii TaxID=2077276 RepID=A0A9W6TG37_9STRA|nr:unnamed protein product [Phytophthora lilii]